MAGFWESILPGGLGAYGYSEVMGDLNNQRDKVAGTIADLTSAAGANTKFTPFGVTSNVGSATGDASGVNFGLSPEQQGMSDQLFGNAGGLFGNVMTPRGEREQSVYDRIRATQTPEEERQRLQLNQSLFSSGRGGLSSMEGGGGTPEQLAYETARAEAMNRASLAAMGQANAEQLQDYNIGQGMLSSSYTPLQELQKTFGYGLNTSQLAQRGQLEGASLMAQLGLGGLTADTNYSNIQGNAFGNMIKAALPLAGGIGQSIDGSDWWKKLWENI